MDSRSKVDLRGVGLHFASDELIYHSAKMSAVRSGWDSLHQG